MELIDEEGNLFGVANVIDVFAVLVVLSVVVSGIFLVSGGGLTGGPPRTPTHDGTPTATPVPTESATRFVTVELGAQPVYVAEQIDPGDVVATGRSGAITITDVYASPLGGSSVAVAVRARVDGYYLQGASRPTAAIRFANGTIRPGRSLKFATAEYKFSGRVVNVEQDGPEVDKETVTAVVVLKSVSPERAEAVETGMRERSFAGTYARITRKESRPAQVVVQDADGNLSVQSHPDRRDVTLEVELTVRNRTDGYSYDGNPLSIGSTIELNFRTVTVEATVETIDDDSS